MARKVAVVGAGIAGLATAIACRNRGLAVTVHERATRISNIGGGLVIYPHGMRALHHLGLADKFGRLYVPLRRYQVHGSENELLLDNSLDDFIRRAGASLMPVIRNHLQTMMARELGYDLISFGQKCISVEQCERHAVAHFADGCSVEADVVIGGDGVNSAVARTIDPQRDVRYSGICFWGGVLSQQELVDIPDDAVAFWFEHGRACCLWPIPNDRQWWYITCRLGEDEFDHHHDKLRQLRELCHNWCEPINRLLAAEQTHNNFSEQVYDVNPGQRWVDRRIGLVGDAAHAITPTTGQGANSALEDSIVLAECLSASSGSVKQGLLDYESRRRPTVDRVREIEVASANSKVTYDLETIRKRDLQISSSDVTTLLEPFYTGCFSRC